VPTNGVYLPAANSVGISTNSTEAMRLDSNGRLGLGTSSPTSRADFQISSGAESSNAAILSASPNSDVTVLRLQNTDTTIANSETSLLLSAGGSFAAQHSLTVKRTGSAIGDLIFRRRTGGSASAESLRIDSSGRLLVGTSTSVSTGSTVASFLQINSLVGIAVRRNSNNASASNIVLGKSRSTTDGAFVIVQNNDGIGEIRFAADDGTSVQNNAASIGAFVDGTPGANDMPGRLVFSTTASGASSPTERARLTNTGALLVGTTATPTGAGSGAVVAQDRVVIGSTNAGRNQTIVGDTGSVTATTGTVVFKFKGLLGTARACYVKLAITQRVNNNTPSNSPAAEYAFQLHHAGTGICSINSTTTIFEHTYDRATHFAFADLGSNECTVTLTNPTALSLDGNYRVEILTPAGPWTLDSVTTT
jgi:hypothetical protein